MGAPLPADEAARPEALRQCEILEAILERITDAFVALDTDWRYIYVNEKAARIFDRRREDLIGKHIWTEFPEGVGQPFYNAYHRAAAEQVPLSLEEYYPPYDRWFENRIYPSKDGLTIFFQDVTERRQREEALRESQERLRLILRSANVGLWDWDLRTNRVHFSPEWKRQIGYEDHEISDDFSEWQGRVHPDDLGRALETVRAFIERPYPNYNNEFRFRHKDGSYRWILAQASLVCDEQGRPIRMLGSHVDITERRREGDLCLTVRDDGAGFDVSAARQRATQGASLGVLGMEERAKLAGGRLEIAYALQVSVKTVETHRAQVMERLGIRDVAGLVRYAIRAGIVSAE